ncbi:hypothetical protein DFS34DRAFT_612666 [Phlyctochytrium arcticum]|nr:hypothetical protein DFS34DRAFT_612666 [Phlyctochytrium arcticum]
MRWRSLPLAKPLGLLLNHRTFCTFQRMRWRLDTLFSFWFLCGCYTQTHPLIFPPPDMVVVYRWVVMWFEV